ncbi:MAG: nucleotide exchange factor GrpE [Methyloligellaceae bacterium]
MNDNTNEKNPEIKENSPASDASESKPEPSKWTENSKDAASDAYLDATSEDLTEEDLLSKFQEENEKLRDQLLRTVAEMDNLRKRTAKEKSDTTKYAITNFARDVLSVGDNMQRAIQAVPEDAISADPALKTLYEGVQMTERELLSVFQRHGIEKIDPKGEPFDPNLHQATHEVPDPTVNSGLCVQVLQSGYMIGDRVLRPAMVGVSKGGVKLQKKPKEGEDTAQAKTVADKQKATEPPKTERPKSEPPKTEPPGKTEKPAQRAETQAPKAEKAKTERVKQEASPPKQSGQTSKQSAQERKVGENLDKNA